MSLIQDALLGRNPEETLSDVSPHASISEVESSVQQEVEIQFGVRKDITICTSFVHTHLLFLCEYNVD